MKILFDKPFIKIPVRYDAPSIKFLISDQSGIIFEINAKYEADIAKVDHFYYADVRRYMGRKLEFSWNLDAVPCPMPDFCESRPQYVHCGNAADTRDSIGCEKSRPAVHFTSPEGWINDPNGLCFYEGKYHIFYQLNPYGNCWSNMTWGHAVSENLVDWEHLDIALFPDETGDMFSGSGIIDKQNILGLNTPEHDAMLLYYTAAANHNVMSADKKFEQYIAISDDGGKTFRTQFGGKPVIPHIVGQNRDPKTVFHKASGKYICSLYFEDHKFGVFSSEDLMDWKLLFELEVEGDDECPAFYPLISPEGKEKWVAQGAFDRYIIGDFDGEKFTPTEEPGILSYARETEEHGQTTAYAAQSFTDLPDGRVIRFSWLKTSNEDDCFKSCLSLPWEINLMRIDGKLKLCAKPAKEVEKLCLGGVLKDLEAVDKTPLPRFCNDIRLTFSGSSHGTTKLDIMGAVFTLDFDGGTISWKSPVGRQPVSTAPFFKVGGEYSMRFITDKLNIEGFFCGGSVTMCAMGKLETDSPYLSVDGQSPVKSIFIYPLRDAIVKDSRTLEARYEMTTIKDIDSFLTALAPFSLSESWDNDGVMLCKNMKESVSSALICLDLNTGAIEKAKEIGAKLIITHHPYIFKPLKRINGDTYSCLEALMQSGISVLSYHTRLDTTEEGVNDALASALGLQDVTSYGLSGDENGMGRIGNLKKPMTAKKFARFVSKALCDGQSVRYAARDDEMPIKRVAVLGGAGKDFMVGAICAGADAFVSADLSHNTFIDGADAGITVIDAGHYYTENPVCNALYAKLSQRFEDVDFTVYNVGSPYKTI